MADTYGTSSREDNADSTVKCWHISYNVDDGGSNTNQFVVVVLAEEMVDPTDRDEAITLANAKALTIKSDWLDVLPSGSVIVDEPTISGFVTL